MTSLYSDKSILLTGASAACVALASATSAVAQTYTATDSVFLPTDWSFSVVGASASKAGSVSQVVNGYAVGSNSRLSNLTPGGYAIDAWAVSIFEAFSYNPSLQPGQPEVTVSFDSRWIALFASRVGVAVRQGGNLWVGYQPFNTTSWQTYSFSGWTSILAGAVGPLPDFSAGAAPIYFGFYQRNGGDVGGFQSEFANFQVQITAPVPGPSVLVSLVAMCASTVSRSRHRRS
jgi:hypothetical protein